MKQYLKLLMTREAKEVLGRNWTNLWLLTLVLVATFSSIAFSEGSMLYLQDKMEDPFTNWVDIDKQTSGMSRDFDKFRNELDDPAIQEKYGFNDVHEDREEYYDMENDKYLRCRHFADIKTPLIQKILAEDNVVGNSVIDSAKLNNNSLGLIITADALKKLGYSTDSVPAYIYYKAYNPSADTLGFTLQEGKFLHIPFPVLAVVRRLPNNVDMMGTNYFSEQPRNDSKYPYDFTVHPDYITELQYFVEGNVDLNELKSAIGALLPDSLRSRLHCFEEENPEMTPWKDGMIIKLDYGEMSPNYTSQQWLELNKKILSLDGFDMVRIYKYDTQAANNALSSRYISLTFHSLDNIRAFEDYAKSTYQIQIDMTQVASKENFNAVTVMAAILSGAMVIFSLVCIIMFLVNMLQSYFQKVKRNIGTFKAFGMNTKELIQAYVFILVMIVCSSIIMALLITWGIQGLLPMVGIEKDGFNYLSLWNPTTYIAAGIVIVSTVFTVSLVMSRMLSQTPGDLIYDRN